MYKIQIPFPVKGLPMKPELTGQQTVDDKIIQSLATLLGWDGESRRLITCAINGALHTVTPPLAGITNVASSGANEDVTFSDQQTTEIIVVANRNNTGDVWVNVDAAAAIDTGMLLDAGDSVKFSINNMQRLNLFIVTNGNKVIILRTV